MIGLCAVALAAGVHIGKSRLYPWWEGVLWTHAPRTDPNKELYPWQEGAPEGRVFDVVHFRRLTRTASPPDWRGQIEDFLAKHPDHVPCAFLGELDHWDTWGCTWFCHETFDQGLDDADVLASFEEYVHRWERIISREDGLHVRCLMGAEDRWRWRGADELPAPCRCDGCKKHGLVRINH